ncbi:ABC transporter substrate-binding protein [Marinirhabdus gelatinilytica]|uniref:Peptide/nickel transport system substrate-binding protein n=1 Tax=Marinirhabdus gelatinilytica TaxID=1703343 RepID=A0A370QFM7_9FLAO|nr:ABC transporter substrate-binding protein [Marinirhabdus gelatinilytica]RDK87168.1 peptide/nickel transport system substrate-binding protein [Marinirhabdus gelatinilytica]
MKVLEVKLYFLFSVFCTAMLCISCSNRETVRPDHLVFRYNEHSNIASLDPAFARNPQTIWPTNQLYNGLVQLNDSLQIQPDIAKSWEVNDTTLTYTFTLRDDVFFHTNSVFGKDSTRTVTAQDFVYSFNRLRSPKVASPGSWVLKNVAHYTAVNDTTLVIQLKQPFPAFLGLLSMRYCSVVPKEAVERYGNEFRRNPVGTGPFQFKMWEENVKLVLRKNPRYFETDTEGNQLPYLEAVAITFLPDKQSEFLQFAQGKLDFVSGLDNSYKDEIITTTGKLQPKYQRTTKLITTPYLNTEYLGFFMPSNTTEIQSKWLRQAINYGFDREKMVTYLRNGMGIPANYGFIPKGLPGSLGAEGYSYKPEKAKELIAKYKTETNDTEPKITIGTNSQYLDVCEYIQRELEKLGIDVAIDVMPPSTLRQMKSSGELDIFRASWIADYPDAENYLSLFYSGNFTPNGPNYTHFKHEVFDSLYVAAQKISDIELRKSLYVKMDSIVIAEAPVVPLYYDVAVRFVSKKVNGLGINPQNFLFLKHVRKEK